MLRFTAGMLRFTAGMLRFTILVCLDLPEQSWNSQKRGHVTDEALVRPLVLGLQAREHIGVDRVGALEVDRVVARQPDDRPLVAVLGSTSSFHLRSKNRITCRKRLATLQRQTHPTRLSQIAREIGIRGGPSSSSIQSFPPGRYTMKTSRRPPAAAQNESSEAQKSYSRG